MGLEDVTTKDLAQLVVDPYISKFMKNICLEELERRRKQDEEPKLFATITIIEDDHDESRTEGESAASH